MLRVVQTDERLETSTADLIVVPVDCGGVAGKAPGVARALRRRYPEVFRAYAATCEHGHLGPGSVQVYEVERDDGAGPRWLALVAVKEHVRDQTLAEHVYAGLLELRDVVVHERVSSVAMAPMGFEPDIASWDDTWRVLQARIFQVFRGISDELVIEVHAPPTARQWPTGCPSVSQLRAGRILSGLGIRELADAAETSPTSITMIENRKSAVPRKLTLMALRQVLESHGVEFGSAGWVRLADDRGLVVDDAASMSRSACMRALELFDKGRRILRSVCVDAVDDADVTDGEN